MRRLVIRPGAIGDVIVSLPALEHLQPSEVWVPGRMLPLITFAPARSIASTGLDLVGITGSPALDALRSFDAIDCWYGANRPDFRQAVSHLPFRFHPALPSDGALHACDFYLHQVGAPIGAVPSIPVARKPQGFVACHPFSGSSAKNWPLANFQKNDVRFCVGPEQDLPGAVCFADLGELATWLATADAYVGNDCGITHLAAAIGLPTLALFGPTDPAVWAPRGKRVRVIKRDRIEEITVQEVTDCLAQLRSSSRL